MPVVPEVPECEIYCKGRGVEVTCAEYGNDEAHLNLCRAACLDCRGPKHECFCPTLFGVGENPNPHPGSTLSPGPGDPPGGGGAGGGGAGGGGDVGNGGITSTAKGIIGKTHFEGGESNTIYVIIGFLIFIILILLCLCCYWWTLRRKQRGKGDQVAYETVTPLTTLRPTTMSPYVGYDYPQPPASRPPRSHRRRDREADDEEAVKDDDEEEASPQPAPPKPAPLQKVEEGQCEDEEECEDDDDEGDDDCCETEKIPVHYEMCM